MSIQRLSNAGQSGFRYKTLIAGITPVASVPVIGEATALTFSTASVTFTAPGAYAGSTFTATSSPGGLTGTSATSPITVSGLSEQTAYTFTVTATNATGTSGPSAASNSVTTPAAFQPDGAFDALSTVTVPSGGLASVTFAGIPNTYKHLQIRMMALSNRATFGVDALLMRFNDDSGMNYSQHTLNGNGASAAASGQGTGSISACYIDFAIGTTVSSYPGVAIIDVLDYASISKNKVMRGLGGTDLNGTIGGAPGRVNFASSAWLNTAAINSITMTPNTGTLFTQYTQISLYGVK